MYFAGCFDCVLTCGCFVPGHLPPDSLYECLRFAKKGIYIIYMLESIEL